MAEVKLTDVFVREVFDRAAIETSLQKSALFQTGAVAADANLAAKVGANDGHSFTDKYHKDLDNSEPEYMDDSDTNATWNKIAEGSYTARKIMSSKSWAQKDMTQWVAFLPATGDALGVIASRVGAWWGRHFDRVSINTMNGVIADNIANDGGDMVHNIWAAAAPAAGNSISAAAVIAAQKTMGDRYDEVSTMVVHSDVWATLETNNLITNIRESDGSLIQFYRNMRLVVSDQAYKSDGTVLTGVGSATHPAYLTYLFGPAVMGVGINNAGVIPSELYRDARTGRGGGLSGLITRQNYSLHPGGFTFTNTTITGQSPSYANLALAANWDRIVTDRKSVQAAVLITRQ